MAHSWIGGPGPLKARAALAAALALVPFEAGALALGEAQLRSGLGEGLDLRIPVTIDKGESIEPACFTLAREGGGGVPWLSAARISLQRSAVATYLRIRTERPINEPALAVGVVAACPGQSAELRRDYSLLVDPPKNAPAAAGAEAPVAAAASSAPAAAPSAAPSTLPSIATLIARIGDTLESIAHAIFPRNRAAKNSYIQALRETNPPLASLGERDPIPVDTPIALPDLRTFSHPRSHAAADESRPRPLPRERSATAGGETAPSAARATPRPAPEPRPRRAAERTTLSAADTPQAREAPAAQPAAPRRPTPARSQAAGPGFVLKLSSGEMDLSPSKSIDDRIRAQLRDRQLVLDADDQVAAVLALRNSVRQLESRVAELQLKLAGMPSSFPAPKGAPAQAAPQPTETAAAPPAAQAANPPVETKPAAEMPAPLPEKTAVPTPPVAAEKPSDTQAVAPPPMPEPKAQPAPSAKKPPARAPEIDWLYYGLWALAFLLVAAAILLAMRLRRRREFEALEFADQPLEAPTDGEIVVAVETPPREDELEEEPPGPSPAAAATPGETSTDDLRRRYIEERFPEIGKGAISLGDPDSVVKGARLFYEDRAIARAVELLQFAIERDPAEVKFWLALFEIFRLEGLKGEFAELAHRFREQHGKSPYWRKVQYFGREIDPANDLYAEKPMNTFETIGPAQAGRFAAEASFDPVAENWLGAPMDFENEVLANELRKALMASAGIGEGDLVPNPMPALRNIEMFTVA